MILRPLMRSALAKALALLLAAGAGACASPCQELGYKLCECRPSGTSKRTCENTVDDELNRQDPTQAEQDTCEAFLKTCDAPKGVAFCTWIEGADGKEACGLTSPETP